MRKVVVYELLSLDGVAEDPDEYITEWDDAMDANLAEVIATQDAVILGRRSYDEWAKFWPTSEIEPFANFINRTEKHVATSSALTPEWANSHMMDDELLEYVRRLKNTQGGDIGVHASLSIAQALMSAGLVDELRLVTAPNTAGAGRRLFDGVPGIHWQCVTVETSPSGYLLTRYRLVDERFPTSDATSSAAGTESVAQRGETIA